MDTHMIDELKGRMHSMRQASASKDDDYKLIFVHNGIWMKIQYRGGQYSEEIREDRSGFSYRHASRWSDRRKVGETIETYNRRMLDTEASA